MTLDHVVSWTLGANVSSLSGKFVRLWFVLSDVDVYSFQSKAKDNHAQQTVAHRVERVELR